MAVAYGVLLGRDVGLTKVESSRPTDSAECCRDCKAGGGGYRDMGIFEVCSHTVIIEEEKMSMFYDVIEK